MAGIVSRLTRPQTLKTAATARLKWVNDMSQKKMIGFVFTCLLCATNAMAGPFGLEMGMSLKDIGGKPEKVASGKYKLSSVPKPHSAFEAYIVQVSPKHGLCWIKAIGKDIRTSAYGLELKSAFNEMKGKLEKSYGKNETIDRLMPGSIWKEPNDFMMGMIKKERFLMSCWDSEKGSTLTEHIKQIGLMAHPSSQDKGYLTIEYSFDNSEACDAELAAQEDGAL